jgi:NADH/F420H2 dehydrogenase subunit C
MEGEERRVEPGRLRAEMEALAAAGYDYLSCVSGVDYLEDGEIEVVYHLFSMGAKLPPVVLKVRTPRDDARLPSVVPIYRSADFQEREIYDLFGVHFEGHPNLKRILLWEGFDGHPLRKDYEPEDEDRPVEMD